MAQKILTIMTLTSLTACSTIPPQYEYQPVVQDKIIAIGKMVTPTQQQIVFAGERYTYIADQGGATVFNIIQNTRPEQRFLMNQMPIQFEMVSDSQFKSTLRLRYNQPIGLLPTNEYQKLKSLGFTQTTTHCTSALIPIENCEYPVALVELSGRIYQQAANQQSIPYKLKQPYPISIVKKVEHRRQGNFKKKAKDVATGVAIVPLAIVGVVIYVPIVLGATLLSGGKLNWH
ncbi:hypothetical protein EC846_0229 [Acinetobacter sp. BIGb0102]|nr:hypothetical protein EC846_0229 [Acinetobacter sp. BIGb0102]